MSEAGRVSESAGGNRLSAPENRAKAVIHGVALLAICTLAGVYVGDRLGEIIGVKANVGGVGIAMILLVLARHVLEKNRPVSTGVRSGIEFWALMYVPIVVAMAATQNVVVAVRGGPLVLVAGVAAVALSFVTVWIVIKLSNREGPVEDLMFKASDS